MPRHHRRTIKSKWNMKNGYEKVIWRIIQLGPHNSTLRYSFISNIDRNEGNEPPDLAWGPSIHWGIHWAFQFSLLLKQCRKNKSEIMSHILSLRQNRVYQYFFSNSRMRCTRHYQSPGTRVHHYRPWTVLSRKTTVLLGTLHILELATIPNITVCYRTRHWTVPESTEQTNQTN